MPLLSGTIPIERQLQFQQVAAAMRNLQNSASSAAFPGAVDAEVVSRINDLVELLTPYGASEDQQLFGNCSDLPGRGQWLSPVLTVDSLTEVLLLGRVELGRFYLGFNDAAHGGVLPLMFDEILSRVINTGRPLSRTARLQVDFRSVTPIGRELHFRAEVDSIVGRKRWARGALYSGDRLCAEARGLFVELRPGQA